MPATAKTLVTAEEFMAMPDPPDGSVQELVRGEIVTMPPPKGMHGIVCNKFACKIGVFVDQQKLGWTTSNDAGVILERGPDTVRGPDVAFYSYAKTPTVPEGYFEVPPDLVVEIVSPHDSFTKLRQKVRNYLRCGTAMVWVGDPDDRTVEVHKSGELTRTLDNGDTLDGDDVLPGFSCKVADLFP